MRGDGWGSITSEEAALGVIQHRIGVLRASGYQARGDAAIMPEISRFLGIVIRMYFSDHEPPHCHASYGGEECQLRLTPVGLLGGSLPPRVLALVVEWASLHQAELHENWRRLQANQAPLRILPLE